LGDEQRGARRRDLCGQRRVERAKRDDSRVAIRNRNSPFIEDLSLSVSTAAGVLSAALEHRDRHFDRETNVPSGELRSRRA